MVVVYYLVVMVPNQQIQEDCPSLLSLTSRQNDTKILEPANEK